jgi:uroporphyrinogen decarboxylase
MRLDVMDPVQIKATGMVPAELKKEYGHLLTFRGGIDEQDLLPHGTPSMVREEVRKMIEIMGTGGGYFLGSTDNFQDDCPTENIIAMYEAAKNI